MANRVCIGMAGLGTVGGGVFEVLKRNGLLIEQRSGHQVQLKTVVCRDIEKAKRLVGNAVEITNDWEKVATDPEIDIVIEVMGGIEPAKSFILTALKEGKDVITANKALLATHGNEIFKVAKEKKRTIAFEAAVAGGIPVIKALREGLAGNRIERIAGIINGTTNFILTMMQSQGLSFKEALAQAQALGYAESDPTFDIEGIDAGHKIAILSALAFGTLLHFDETHITGITQVDLKDIEYAKSLGYSIKLLGLTAKSSEGIDCRVHPTLVSCKSPLANIDNVMNAVLIKGDAVNTLFLSGPGAGAGPTASAVVADLVDILRLEGRNCVTSDFNSADTQVEWLDLKDIQSRYYVRIPKALMSRNCVEEQLSKEGIAIEQSKSFEADFVLLTEKTTQALILKIVNDMVSGKNCRKDIAVLHVMD